jgi:hypothetical protein
VSRLADNDIHHDDIHHSTALKFPALSDLLVAVVGKLEEEQGQNLENPTLVSDMAWIPAGVWHS